MKQYLGWLMRFGFFGIVSFWRIFFAPLVGAVRGALANAEIEISRYEARYREFNDELKAMEQAQTTR